MSREKELTAKLIENEGIVKAKIDDELPDSTDDFQR